MAERIVRKLSFFFNIQNATALDASDKHLVRSYLVGNKVPFGNSVISDIEERIDPHTQTLSYDIYAGTGKDRKLWKSYTPRISDTEIEYQL